MSSPLRDITTQQDLIRAIEVIERDGQWSYAVIQRDMNMPYHKARKLKELISRMGILDKQCNLVADWREREIKDEQG